MCAAAERRALPQLSRLATRDLSIMVKILSIMVKILTADRKKRKQTSENGSAAFIADDHASGRLFYVTERCGMRKVAIGMPVWNGEKFVSEAIESILGQTYSDFELVISDNASTDATAEICRGYAKQDTRIRYFRQTKNIGAGPNHAEVFRLSSGRYFKWACHDDFLAPEFIDECIRVLDADEAVAVCCPATVLINEDGSPLWYSPQLDGMVDTYGNLWRVTENMPLTSADPAERFAAVLCNMDWCFEIYGLIRRSALARASAMPSYYGGDKVLLAQLSLLGRYHLLEARFVPPTVPPGAVQFAANQPLSGDVDFGPEDSVGSTSAAAVDWIFASSALGEAHTSTTIAMPLGHRAARCHNRAARSRRVPQTLTKSPRDTVLGHSGRDKRTADVLARSYNSSKVNRKCRGFPPALSGSVCGHDPASPRSLFICISSR